LLTPALKDIFEQFNDLKVVIVGDVMLDSYLWGDVHRISPEAPVPVVSVTDTENRLGGAANVALNVAALGATPIVCTVIGGDEKGELLHEIFEKGGLTADGLVRSSFRPTTVKTRIISDGQHLLRVDREKTDGLSPFETENLLHRLEQILDHHDPHVVIFQDYNKGVLTEEVITSAISMCKSRDIPMAVDPKKDHFLSYRGVDLFKPNLKELKEGLKTEINGDFFQALEQAMNQLHQKLNHRISLVTLSERGAAFTENGKFRHIAAHDRKIIDVSGAGDTVISVAALALALKLETDLLAALANLAGGLVCEQVGVVPIDKDQLFNEATLLRGAR
jgi:rfaE bifunctional protein kinase chain/domain